MHMAARPDHSLTAEPLGFRNPTVDRHVRRGNALDCPMLGGHAASDDASRNLRGTGRRRAAGPIPAGRGVNR